MSTATTTVPSTPTPFAGGPAPPEVQAVNVSDRHVLVDLNKQLKNFHLDFTVQSNDPSKEFEVLVINQKQLDLTGVEGLPLRKVRETTSGTVRADSDVYHNYFLVLRSATPQVLQVSTRLVPISPASAPLQSKPRELTVGGPPSESSGAQASAGSCPSWTQWFVGVFGVASVAELYKSRLFWIALGIFGITLWWLFIYRKSAFWSTSRGFVGGPIDVPFSADGDADDEGDDDDGEQVDDEEDDASQGDGVGSQRSDRDDDHDGDAPSLGQAVRRFIARKEYGGGE